MVDNNYSRNAEEISRREHNEVAMAKRVIGILYDYINEEYRVPGADKNGNALVKGVESVSIRETLESIENLLKTFLKHMECITQSEFNTTEEEEV